MTRNLADAPTQLVATPASSVASIGGLAEIAEATPSGIRRFAADRPITLLVAFIICGIWPLMAVPLLAHHGVVGGRFILDAMPMGAEETTSILMVAALFGFSTWLVRTCTGPGALRALLRRTFRASFGAPGWLLVIAAMPVTTVTLGMAFGRDLVTDDLAVTVTKGLGVLVVLVLVVNLWEETIFSGFVQTRLERRHRLPVAAALAAIPFSLVHVPLAFVDESFSVSVAVGQFVLLMALTVFFRTLLGVTMRGLDNSVLAVAILHTSFNRSNNRDGLADQLLTGTDQSKFGLLAMLVILGAASITWRRRLSRSYRVELDVAEGVVQ